MLFRSETNEVGAITTPTFAALQTALNDVLGLDPACAYATNDALNGTITFDDALVFAGDHTVEIRGPMTFDGGGKTRFFVVPAGFTLRLVGITFVNGKVSGEDESGAGGAILVQDGGALEVSNCTFRACAATYGGAVALLGETSRASFTDCMFEDNTATGDGNAIYNESSSALAFSGTTIDWADITDYTPAALVSPRIATFVVATNTASVTIAPELVQPNVYYGLGWSDDLNGSFTAPTIWVKANGKGELAAPLTAPAEGALRFYRVFARERK